MTRHPVLHQPLVAQRGTAADQAARRTWLSIDTRAPHRHAQACLGSAKLLAHALPEDAWNKVTWRAGTNAPLSGRVAAVRVRPAHRDVKRTTPRPEEWFMVEWPEGDAEPAKYWLATLPASTPIAEFVANAKRRWRIERDYQELNGEIGLGHYEGRGWRGFHHHATLCIAACGFLVAEKCFSPSAAKNTAPLKGSQIPANFRPRGSANPA